MDRGTRNILLIAIVVIALLFIMSGRALPLLNNLRGREVEVNPNVALPTVAPSQNVPPPPSQNVTVQPNVAVTATNTVPGPLLNLESPPGFFSGLLHGFISPFMLVLSLFMPNVRMYALNNTGPYYDLGFLLGIVLLLALTQVGRVHRYYYHRRYRRGYVE